ncbi:hypothetical protein CRUP_036911 [Coryphaenoides rupestris]|nr:hypothetical protein CRUP_036911 [Coryphaenoides rupestris]
MVVIRGSQNNKKVRMILLSFFLLPLSLPPLDGIMQTAPSPSPPAAAAAPASGAGGFLGKDTIHNSSLLSPGSAAVTATATTATATWSSGFSCFSCFRRGRTGVLSSGPPGSLEGRTAQGLGGTTGPSGAATAATTWSSGFLCFRSVIRGRTEVSSGPPSSLQGLGGTCPSGAATTATGDAGDLDSWIWILSLVPLPGTLSLSRKIDTLVKDLPTLYADRNSEPRHFTYTGESCTKATQTAATRMAKAHVSGMKTMIRFLRSAILKGKAMAWYRSALMQARVTSWMQQLKEKEAICTVQITPPACPCWCTVSTMTRMMGQSTAQRRRSTTARFTSSALFHVRRVFWWYTAHVTKMFAPMPTREMPSRMMQLATRKLNHSVELQGGRSSLEENERAIRMVLFMIVAFFVCWLPYTVLSVVVVADPQLHIPPLLATMPMYFAKTSPVYNPVIYFLSNKEFRDAALELLSCGRYIPHGPSASGLAMRSLHHRNASAHHNKVLPL